MGKFAFSLELRLLHTAPKDPSLSHGATCKTLQMPSQQPDRKGGDLEVLLLNNNCTVRLRLDGSLFGASLAYGGPKWMDGPFSYICRAWPAHETKDTCLTDLCEGKLDRNKAHMETPPSWEGIQILSKFWIVLGCN